jgi:hypothetical protein
VLKIEGKCSYLRAKVAHISGHLPLRARHDLLSAETPQDLSL